MKIRPALVLLIAAALAPVVLLAATTIQELWRLQRGAYEQQFLERVSALRLALDTDLESTFRWLRTLAEVRDLDSRQRLPGFTERLPRLLAQNPNWTTVGVMAPDGSLITRLDRRPLPASVALDRATAQEVERTRRPQVSDFVEFEGASYMTFAAAPIVRNGAYHGAIYIGIEPEAWLEFLRSYPIAEGATLVLNDRSRRIIARTLNPQNWIGKYSSTAFWDRTVGKDEAVYQAPGLEGQKFYTAFSRSKKSGWLISTGVPEEQVEAALRVPTALLVGGIAAAALLALLLALVFGRRVANALTALAEQAEASALPGTRQASPPLAVEEAETVRRALEDASDKLRGRERSLSEALAREETLRGGAEQANRAKDEFLAMLGHELRNPLSAMKNAVTLLDMAAGEPEVAERARAVLKRQLRQLTDIMDDLLDVSRLTSGKVVLNRKVLDVAEVSRNVVLAFNDAGRCAHLRLELQLETVQAFVDETRLGQVVANLLDNACKYTPPGRRALLSVAPEGTDVVIRVADEGSGIAADLLPRVFDLFAQGARTLDRAQGGLGLGLTVVRRLVELHGGSVTAESEGADRGACFTVRLPRAIPAHGDIEPAAVAELRPLRIVVVEDNTDNRDSIAALLERKGHQVTVAQDGPSGMQQIAETRPDVALVDIGLPGFDGIELARRLRASPEGQRVRLVALTGYGREEDRLKALDAGFDAFLAKPFDLQRFEAALQVASAKIRSLRARSSVG